MPAERVEEASQRGLVVAGRCPDQPAGVMVDHDRQVAVALAVGDLIDADAPQALQTVDALPGLLRDAGDDPADGAPGNPQQLGDGGLGGVDCQPRRGVLELAREPRTMPGPGDGGDHHAVLAAAHSGRVGLQQRRHGPKVQRPPAPSTLALIEAGAASAADPTAPPAPSCRSHRRHDRVGLLIEADRFHDGVLDAEQPCPYPSYLHAVSPFYGASLGQPEP